MTFPTPASALATMIHASIPSWVLGVNMFTGPVRAVSVPAIPQNALFVREYGGPAPETQCGESVDVLTISVQVLLRGNADKYADALSQARAVWTAVQRCQPAGYIQVLASQPHPIDAGKDSTGSQLYTINVEMMMEA